MTAFRTPLLHAAGQKVDSFNLDKLPSVSGKISRGNQTRLELFGSEFDGWPAVIMESMFDAA